MADETPRPPRPSLLATPIGRRRALAVMGSSAALVALEACVPGSDPLAPRGWVTADVDPAKLRLDEPVTARFSGTIGGADVSGSVWLVLREADELVAFDPNCPHASCAYELTDDRRFSCLCHEAFFDIDGNVISGPPRRPLDEYRVRVVDGRVEVYISADFATPRPTD